MADLNNLGSYEPAFQNLGIGFYVGSEAPSFSAPKGSIYINTTATTTTTRFYINSDGSTTWVYVTTSA